MSRPDKDTYFLAMAALVASRSTCARRAVGCVLVDGRGHVLSTGYNGRAAGLPHCDEPVPTPTVDGPPTWSLKHACAGHDAPRGSGADRCEALHAEQNALLQCRDVDRIRTAYVTLQPCDVCTKLLLNTPCERLVVLFTHYHAEGQRLWETAGRQLTHQHDGSSFAVLKDAGARIWPPT